MLNLLWMDQRWRQYTTCGQLVPLAQYPELLALAPTSHHSYRFVSPLFSALRWLLANPVLQHAGIPAADLRILDLNGSYQAAYHSIYDSYYWMTKFGDPTGEYFQAIARVWGMVALRLSEDLFLPFNFTRYGIALREYAMQAENLAKSAGQHGIDFTVLHEAVARYQAAVSVFNTEIAHADLSNPFILRALNDRMMARFST